MEDDPLLYSLAESVQLKELHEMGGVVLSRRHCSGRTFRSRKKKEIKSVLSCDHHVELVHLRKWMKKHWSKSNSHLNPSQPSPNPSFLGDSSCCSSHSFNLCSLRAVSFPTTGRGLMALKQFRAGDVLVSIPRHIMVSSCDVAKNDIIREALEKTASKLTSCELLALFLLYHKFEKQSSWQAYIESLPKVFFTSCLDEALLYPSFIGRHLTELLSTLDAACSNIQNILSHIKRDRTEISSSDVKWAYMAVNSRTVYLKPQQRCRFLASGDEGCCALAPFLDLLNHSFEASVSVELDRCGMYKIVTHVPYSKYDQVFINYGPHDNVKLFVEYGFFIPNNPHDGIPVSIRDVLSTVAKTILPASTIASLDVKEKIVDTLGEAKNMFLARDGPSWSLEIVVTILLLPQDEFDCWRAVYNGSCVAPNSRSSVRSVLTNLVTSVFLSLTKSLERMVAVQDKTEHLKIGCSLVEDYISLVEGCLKACQDE